MNNVKVLEKILAEVVKPTPDLSYVRGMLETLIESFPNSGAVILNAVQQHEQNTALVDALPETPADKYASDPFAGLVPGAKIT